MRYLLSLVALVAIVSCADACCGKGLFRRGNAGGCATMSGGCSSGSCATMSGSCGPNGCARAKSSTKVLVKRKKRATGQEQASRGAKKRGCSSACTCGCAITGVCNCRKVKSFK